MRNLGLGFNEIMICILAVVFYGFMVTMEELDKDYNKFSEEDREEAKGIIEKSLEGKIGKGIFMSGILALGICFYIKSGSTSLRSLVDTVFIDQLLSMTKYVIRFFYFLSLFFGILLFYLLIILYRPRVVFFVFWHQILRKLNKIKGYLRFYDSYFTLHILSMTKWLFGC